MIAGVPPTAATSTWGSDRIAGLLSELGYRYVALNPGATFRGLHDSLANVEGAPRIILATHEEISVAIAHGYAKVTGEPMAAAVHDVVGLQHATMAIFNAWCDQAPVLVVGGTGPVDAAHRRPYIDWVHTALVQGQLVRDYVKWDDQPASLEAALESLVRADRIVRMEPPGPAYVCLDVEIQEAPVADDLGPVARPARAAAMHPDPKAVSRAADWLLEAERPLVVADMLGRSPDAVADLVRLAERLALPVIDLGGRFNFPTSHPLDATDAGPDLEAPDRPAGPLDSQDPLGGGDQCVAAVLHRHGARVPRLAGERDLGVALTGDRRHDADRLAQPLQHRTLLDMDLDVCLDVVAGGKPVPPTLAHEVAEPHVAVTAVQPRRVEAAGQRGRAEVGRAEADALLVGEGDDLEVALGACGRLDGDQYAERAVVAPGVDHGVEMGAEHEEGAVAAAPDQVAHRVLACVQARLLHPAGHERVRPLHRLGAEAAGQARRLLAYLREDVAPLEHAGGAAQLPR
jgi:hypothetical protein